MSQMSTNSLCIKLIFEEKDHFMIYKWRTKLEEAVGYSRSRLTPFQKMKNESSLKSDPSQGKGHPYTVQPCDTDFTLCNERTDQFLSGTNRSCHAWFSDEKIPSGLCWILQNFRDGDGDPWGSRPQLPSLNHTQSKTGPCDHAKSCCHGFKDLGNILQ